MSDLSEMIGTDTVNKITVGGKGYEIGEMDLNDWADIEKRIKLNFNRERTEKIKIARELYGASQIPSDVFMEISKSITSDQLTQSMDSIDSLTFVLVRLIQKANPSLVEKEIQAMIKMGDIDKMLKDAGLMDKEVALPEVKEIEEELDLETKKEPEILETPEIINPSQ